MKTDNKKINDGGPAFPWWQDGNSYPEKAGMTMRDWFAGKALTGILADKNYTLPVMPLQAAELAYKYANAMLIQRAKNNTNNEN